ncbi:Putative conjugal transfer protein [Poriferisphaera corsica]|uniref:Conjugal transfer protein n=1 Tax=Poriferisphaera corsica TaxID=2528020 RepID=A0A517YUY6_9BACT|nr:ATPase, T2SS/T4P/T4SS family [Poriferisphaera corsica]QDU34037.1 Putative conjugal transfer protein [Poriferisphaera corsica]
MIFWVYDHSTNTRNKVEVNSTIINIGRDASCQLHLKSAFVAKKHARIIMRGNQMFLESTSLAGTRIANQEIEKGEPKLFDFGDEIQIGQFSLTAAAKEQVSEQDRSTKRNQQDLMAFEQKIHSRLLDLMNLRVTGHLNKQDANFVTQVQQHLNEILNQNIEQLSEDVICYACSLEIYRLVSSEVVRQCRGHIRTEYQAADDAMLDPLKEQDIVNIVNSIVDLMPLLFDPTTINEDLAVADESFEELFTQHYASISLPLRRYIVYRSLSKDILDILFGLGPLQDLLEMPSVSEIMVVGKDNIYIEKNGIIQNTSRNFFSNEILLSIIERILAPVGRRVDTSVPLVDARLSDGSRVNVVISPLSLTGPCLTIRKFGWVPFTMDDLIDRGSISEQCARFLQGCIIGKKNIIISGGTASGKTTLLNVLSAYARQEERIITIEESAELSLPQPHVVPLEGRPANVEGKGAFTIRELVRNALRMRPDRIIVGEVRGSEALDMLQAMNTGHDGSLSTLHANSPYDAAKRLETLVLMGVDMPIRAIREQIVSAVDLIVQISRFPDGSRRIANISELTSIDRDTGKIFLEDIFTLKNPKQPRLRHTGYLPAFSDELIEKEIFDVGVFL